MLIIIILINNKIIIHLSLMSFKTWLWYIYKKRQNKNNDNYIHGAIIAGMTFNLENMTGVKNKDSGWKYCQIIIITNRIQSVN